MAFNRLLRNGLANVATGISTSILTLIVPFFFVRTLQAEDFALWMLLFPLANYFNFIGLGFQISLSRFIAVGSGTNTTQQQSMLLRRGLVQLTVVSVLAMLAFSVFAAFLQDIFPSMAGRNLQVGKVALLVLCLANAVALPFSLYGAAFVGVQRNDRNAVAQLGSKSFVAVSAIGAAMLDAELQTVALAYLASTVLAAICQRAYFHKLAPFDSSLVAPTSVGDANGGGLLRYSLSLSVWSAVSLVLVAAPTAVVGAVDYGAAAGFSIANSLLTFLIGIFNALIAPMTQSVAARYGAKPEPEALHGELRRFSFISSSFLILAGTWLVVCAPAFLHVWVGASRAAEAIPFIFWLTLANVVRNLQSPFSIFVIAVGKQSKVFWLPVIEACIATTLSIVLGRSHGAMAVAMSLAFAAVVGAVLTAVVAVPMTLEVRRGLPGYLLSAVGSPLMVAAPAIAVAAYMVDSDSFGCAPFIALLAVTMASLGLLMRLFRRMPHLVPA